MIDLNEKRKQRAAKREGGTAPVPIHFLDATFYVPPELPMTVVDRCLDPDMEIAQLLVLLLRAVKTNVAAGKTDAATGDIDTVISVLTNNAELPLGVVRSLKQAVAEVFGAEQWQRYEELKPSLEDNAELFWELVRLYGSRLGELFKSLAPAKSGGATSNATSNGSMASTPEASGQSPEPPTSLVSVG